MVENKETPKTTNPYIQPTLVKCFKCNLPSHRLSEYPLRKAVYLVEREEEKEDEVYYKPDEDGEEDLRMMLRGRAI